MPFSRWNANASRVDTPRPLGLIIAHEREGTMQFMHERGGIMQTPYLLVVRDAIYNIKPGTRNVYAITKPENGTQHERRSPASSADGPSDNNRPVSSTQIAPN